MMEDFGDWGDEVFLGFCAEDWRDYLPEGASWEERQRVRENLRRQQEEAEVDDHWDMENERDLCDIVREHEEEEDWLDDGDDYLDGSWEE